MNYPLNIIKSAQDVERYQCSVCGNILDNPHQDQCGHRLCFKCFIRKKETQQLCSHCLKEENTVIFPVNQDYQPIPDNAIKREMMKLEVICLNEKCTWNGLFKNIQEHLENCPFKPSNNSPTICDICLERLPEDTTQDDHITSNISKHLIHFNNSLLALVLQNNHVYERFKELPTIASLEDQLKDVKNELELCKNHIYDLQRKILHLENTSYNGNFMWKIIGFAEKMLQAQNGNCTSILSPVFYTNRYGYKVRASLYLNGDRAARGSHISIFLILMNGEYDAVLQWPFQHSVTFTLIDQTPSKDCVIASFKPDLESSSFYKPTSSNLPSGFPYFISLKTFREQYDKFVVDDTAFINVDIHNV